MKFIITLIMLAAAVSPTLAQGGLQNTTPLIKKDVFEKSLSEALAPTTMGYQFVLIKDGQVVSEKAGGKARSSAEGNLPMTLTTPMDIGSLFKFITGTTMLNLMEKGSEKMNSDVKKLSFDGKLDRRIWGELPAVWLDVFPKPSAPSPQQRNITYRQLMQHRSGFDDQWNVANAGKRPFLEFMEKGFLASQYDVREYTNINFTAVGFLIPLLERNFVKYDLNQQTWNASTQKPSPMSQADADLQIRTELGKGMDKLMRERIWSKMKPTFNPSCDPTNDPVMKNTAAYAYNSPQDTTGVITSHQEISGYCGGEGGYYMSVRDFANYIKHFSQTDLIVSKTVRDKMYNETMDAEDRLVWANDKADDFMKKNFNMPIMLSSNGGTGSDGTGGNRTVLMRLPQNTYLIIFSNTRNEGNGQNGTQLFNFGRTAFKEATKHNF